VQKGENVPNEPIRAHAVLSLTHADLPSLDDAQADGVSRARNLPVVPILPPRAAVDFFRTKRG